MFENIRFIKADEPVVVCTSTRRVSFETCEYE